MIEGRGQTRSGLNHHEATGTRKEVGVGLWWCIHSTAALAPIRLLWA